MMTHAKPGRRIVLACVAALALGAVFNLISPATAQTVAPAPSQLSGPALLSALRGGGYVLYFRHAATDFSQNDDHMTGYEDCATQRNLTDRGRADARAMGVAIAALAIPIGDVIASPFCRTQETARLIFGRATSSPAARGGPAQESAERYAPLRALLSTPVPRGTNLVIVSHGNPYRALVGGSYLAEGEAALIEPHGKDGFIVIARVPQEEWTRLAAAAK